MTQARDLADFAIAQYPVTADFFVASYSGSVSDSTLTFPTASLTSSNNVTLANNVEITPSVAGRFLVVFYCSGSMTASGGFTPSAYIYKNTASVNLVSGIRNHTGGAVLDWPTVCSIVDVNGSTDYIKVAVHTNGGAVTLSGSGGCTALGFRIDQ